MATNPAQTGIIAPMDAATRDRLVTPFYLKMMRTNAAEHGSELVPAIADVGRDTTADDVVMLLRDPWRSTVMGSWFALLHDELEVVEAVLIALASSHGSLDAPPLATVAVVLASDQALPALREYAARDVNEGWGACGFIAAAIDHVGGDLTVCSPGDDDDRNFAELLAVAHQLRDLK